MKPHQCESVRVDVRKSLAIVHGREFPIEAVAADPATDPPDCLYFSVFLSDWREHEDEPDGAELCCAGCFLDEHPEVGRGFDLAKRGRSAWSYDPASDEWTAARY